MPRLLPKTVSATKTCKTHNKRLYHLGMDAVAKSTLSEAMSRRNPEIFKALFEEILDRVMSVAPKDKFKFKNPLHAIDSTTIDLCLSYLADTN